MADRFFCPTLPGVGRVLLDGAEAHHLARVCRLAIGDRVELFDGKGFGALAIVRTLGKGTVELEAVERTTGRAAARELTLAVAVPKGERFDWLVEKATELGVARLVPLMTERSSVAPRDTKLERLRRAVIEASKQCGRNQLMTIEGPRPFGAYLQAERAPDRVLADPGGLAGWSWPPSSSPVALAVGPEGGFTPGEVESARALGWRPAALGATLLRIETAALVGAALLLVPGPTRSEP